MIRTLGTPLVLVLVFDLCSWHRAHETLVISWVIGVAFAIMGWLWMDCWMPPGWEPVPKKTKPWWEDWNSQPYLFPFIGEGTKTEDGVIDGSCLCDDISTQISNAHHSKSFQVGKNASTHGWCIPNPQGQKLLCSRPFWTWSYVSLNLAVHLDPLSYPLINDKCTSLSSVSCSHLQRMSEAQVVTQACWTVGVKRQSCGIWHSLPVDRVRTELNCRTHKWCH